MHTNFHETILLRSENMAERDLFKHSLRNVFYDLHRLELVEGRSQFIKDLGIINTKLHQDGWLPTVEIVVGEAGRLKLLRQSQSKWVQERHHAIENYYSSSFAAPKPAFTPQGFNSGYAAHEGKSHRGGYALKSVFYPNEQGDRGRFDYNPDLKGSVAERILSASHNAVGSQMWRLTDNGASGGNLGCASSLSSVLRQAGLSQVSELDCYSLQAALKKQGWTVASSASPGDVVFGFGGLSRAHVGIVDEHGRVEDNHSNNGQWSVDNLSYFANWNTRVFLHPPETIPRTS